MITELNEDNFKDKIISWITLIDFWEDNCSPCEIMSEILDEFAISAKKELKIWKINWKYNNSIIQKYRVLNTPTLMLFKEWKAVGQLLWVRTKDDLQEFTNLYI